MRRRVRYRTLSTIRLLSAFGTFIEVRPRATTRIRRGVVIGWHTAIDAIDPANRH